MEYLRVLWDTNGYVFWLILASLFCMGMEQLFPWRVTQKKWRKEIVQDIAFLVLNGYFFGRLLGYLAGEVQGQVKVVFAALEWTHPSEIQLLGGLPLAVQFVVLLVARDFVEWCVHNLLHRVSWLWQFHKVHHSIVMLDWIGNFRFHWMETIIYETIKWLPLTLLGVSYKILLPLAVFTTLIGHLNHSNLKWNYGPLRYVFNSPMMHVWHHDVEMHHKGGQNFGVIFSFWDWIFKTVYWPEAPLKPAAIGFEGLERFPSDLLSRLSYPLSETWNRKRDK